MREIKTLMGLQMDATVARCPWRHQRYHQGMGLDEDGLGSTGGPNEMAFSFPFPFLMGLTRIPVHRVSLQDGSRRASGCETRQRGR